MTGSDKKKAIQLVLGGLIVIGAFAIMAQGVLYYVFSLWRIISLIVTMIIVAWLIVFIYHKLCPKKEESKNSKSQRGGAFSAESTESTDET